MSSNLSTSTSCGYGDVRTVKMSFDDAVARIEDALKTEGFGVLCQIDIQAKLKEKLGVDFPRYVILGACNPPLAQQALQRDINLGLLLPCNVVVYEEGGQVHVGAVDAVRMLSVANHTEMEELAGKVNEKLRRALDSITPQPTAQDQAALLDKYNAEDRYVAGGRDLAAKLGTMWEQ